MKKQGDWRKSLILLGVTEVWLVAQSVSRAPAQQTLPVLILTVEHKKNDSVPNRLKISKLAWKIPEIHQEISENTPNSFDCPLGGQNDIVKLTKIENSEHFHWLDENIPIAIIFQKNIYFKERRLSYTIREKIVNFFIQVEKNETTRFACIKFDRISNLPHLTK